jgi:hypothetical protein
MQSLALKQYLDGTVRPDNGSTGNFRAFTANYSIGDADGGDVLTNAGASGALTFQLPAPKNGRVFRFMKIAQQNFVIKAGTTSKINGGGVNGTYTNSAAEAAKFVEVASDGTDWYILSSTGTWVTA